MNYNILLNRLFCNGEDILGIMYYTDRDGNIRYCWTLEDEYREIKKHGDTRILAGQYLIRLRKEGITYEKYCNHKNLAIRELTKKYGMLELQDVPNFKYILIHIGNTDKDTEGCILVGNEANNSSIHKGMISESTVSYIDFVSAVFKAFELRKTVYISINDLDRQVLKQYGLIL